jgi:hypothetical protein
MKNWLAFATGMILALGSTTVLADEDGRGQHKSGEARHESNRGEGQARHNSNRGEGQARHDSNRGGNVTSQQNNNASSVNRGNNNWSGGHHNDGNHSNRHGHHGHHDRGGWFPNIFIYGNGHYNGRYNDYTDCYYSRQYPYYPYWQYRYAHYFCYDPYRGMYIRMD